MILSTPKAALFVDLSKAFVQLYGYLKEIGSVLALLFSFIVLFLFL